MTIYYLFIIDNDAITVGNLAAKIKERIEKNMYPRFFVITEGITIFPKADKDNLIQKSYGLFNLDFRDKITGINIQYDLIVQKINVQQSFPSEKYFLTKDTKQKNYYSISGIEVNTIMSNNPNKQSVSFYFKVNGTSRIVYVNYKLFDDILQILGSYFSIFSLVAEILSGFYTDFFYMSDLLNSVFQFHDKETLRKMKLADKEAPKEEKEEKEEKHNNIESISVASNKNERKGTPRDNQISPQNEFADNKHENGELLELKTAKSESKFINKKLRNTRKCWNG